MVLLLTSVRPIHCTRLISRKRLLVSFKGRFLKTSAFDLFAFACILLGCFNNIVPRTLKNHKNVGFLRSYQASIQCYATFGTIMPANGDIRILPPLINLKNLVKAGPPLTKLSESAHVLTWAFAACLCDKYKPSAELAQRDYVETYTVLRYE